MKSSEAARPLSKKAPSEVDDLLGGVSKLSLCLSTRCAVGVCSRIRGRSKLHGNVVHHGVELLLFVSILFLLAIPKSLLHCANWVSKK